MTPTKLASGALARAGEQSAPSEGVGPFVLNLCSSSTPMALGQAQIPELKQFSFFVSRRLEEGRERFRLHMGYFPTLAEAQEWLNLVRDIYPGAWAGEAPGKKLRERAAAAQAQQAHAAAPAPAAQAARAPAHVAPTATAQVHAPAPAAAATAAKIALTQAEIAARAVARPGAQVPTARPAQPPLNVPTLRAAAPPANIPVARAAQVQPGRAPIAPAPARTAAARAAMTPAPTAASAAVRAPAPKPAARASATAARAGTASAARPGVPTAPRAGAQRPAASAAAAARPVGKGGTAKSKSVIGSSNVKEVLAALDETTGETRMMPAPAMPPDVRNAGPRAGSASHAAAPPADDPSLSDTQVLRFLETRRSESGERPANEADTGISLLKPDDTGTRRALKTAVVENAPVSFAVQLQWSVQPVELDKVPPLAIFSAYTLYTVEGSRDGRRWYGLRLGFFTDAISAKQVAYYVRSEFASVAVVPVSPQERERATDDEKSASLSQPKKARSQPVDEFKLIDVDDQPELPRGRDTVAPSSAAPTARAGAPAFPKRTPAPAAAPQAAPSRRGGRVRAREQRSPQTLEETLEILGASQLEIDNGSGEGLNDTGVRHLRVEVQKNTPFRRLIERLSERVKKN